MLKAGIVQASYVGSSPPPLPTPPHTFSLALSLNPKSIFILMDEMLILCFLKL